MQKPLSPTAADDGTTTHPYVIQQGAWYRGARNFTVIPLAPAALLVLVGVLNESGALVSLSTALIGICLFPSLMCLMRYASMARRDPEGGPKTFLKRFTLLIFLIAMNVGLATGAALYANFIY